MKIGLALSGGGNRAGVFHAGVLLALAKRNLLEKVSFISSVSGGSLLVGHIFKFNNYQWPKSKEYIEIIFPLIKKTYISYDLQQKITKNVWKRPWKFFNRLKCFYNILKKDFGITENLQDLPDYPRWSINANCLQTGKSWRFTKDRMGDYLAGYVIKPEFPIAEAIAISAGYPVYLNPYKLNVNKYQWSEFKDKSFISDEIVNCEPKLQHVQLQDGGMYENTGTEALFHPWPQELRDGIDKIIVSDASIKASIKDKLFYSWSKRQIDIVSDQVCNLRIQGIMSYLIQNKGNGMYLDFVQNHKSFVGEEKIQRQIIDDTVNDLINFDTNLHCVPETLFDNVIDFTEELVDSLIGYLQ